MLKVNFSRQYGTMLVCFLKLKRLDDDIHRKGQYTANEKHSHDARIKKSTS